jgi:hypothetical protein
MASARSTACETMTGVATIHRFGNRLHSSDAMMVRPGKRILASQAGDVFGAAKNRSYSLLNREGSHSRRARHALLGRMRAIGDRYETQRDWMPHRNAARRTTSVGAQRVGFEVANSELSHRRGQAKFTPDTTAPRSRVNGLPPQNALDVNR